MPKKKKKLLESEQPENKKSYFVIYLCIFFMGVILILAFSLIGTSYDKEHYDALLVTAGQRDEQILDLCKIIEQLDPDGEYIEEVQWIVNRIWGD